MVENLEYMVEPDQALKDYLEVRNYMYFLLLFNLIFEVMMTAYVVKNEFQILNNLKHIYRLKRIKDF